MATKRKRSAAATNFPALRALTADDVEFEVTTESEDDAPEDYFSDPRDSADIRKRLEAGDDAAWCIVVVTARWNGFKGWASIGGCSLSEDYTEDTVVSEHDMKQEALDHLNLRIKAELDKLAPLMKR